MSILSIQSHVAYGYVGNRAAVFPLQRMGYDVTAVHTVQFSNHTGYESWTGDVFDPDHIRRVIGGLAECGVLDTVSAMLSGYAGSAEIGAILLETLDMLPKGTPWICDPVMGDMGRGFFVGAGIPEFFKNHAIKRASVVTPNLFELEYLSDSKINSLDDARAACHTLHGQGVTTILLTSLVYDGHADNCISMLASHANGDAFLVTTPLLPLFPAPNGAGDCTAAVFTGHLLRGAPLDAALSATASSIFGVLEATHNAGTRELALISGQEEFVNPTHPFQAVRVDMNSLIPE